MRTKRPGECQLGGFLLTLILASPAAHGAGDATGASEATARKVDFLRDIEPILKQSCHSCHGPSRQEGGLRLDEKDAALAGGDSGPVILPGNASGSLLVRLVSGLEPGKVMPKKGDRLSREILALLSVWIDQGAEWPADAGARPRGHEHWAFRRPARPEAPSVKDATWLRNTIDSFILARIEAENLPPSAETDRATLIRRVSLDLTGIPASLAEIDAFLADERPDAYERVVDRLLASPRHGERWGRHWLDAARYADTNGYEKDVPRNIWPYRDWVIDAVNRDLPFDRFTIEQVAGDLLPDATLETRVATGFFRNSMLNEEGGVDPEQFRVEAIVDRVDALGKAFLGLTLACGQCHNHKYDPISQVEYYRVFAFLNNDDEPEIEVPSPRQVVKREETLARIRKIEDDLLAAEPDLSERMAAWEEESRRAAGDWSFLEMDDVFGAIGVKFEKLDDQSLLALAHNPGESVYTIKVKTHLSGITAFRLEALTDANLPRMGPGRAPNGNFVIQELTIEAAPIEKPSELVKIALQNATADFSQQGLEVAKAIDGEAKTGWGVDAGPGRNQDRKAVFETKDAVGFDGGTLLVFNLLQKHGGAHTLGRFRLSATAAERPVRADPVPSAVRRILARPAGGRSSEERRAVFSHYRTTQERFAEPNRKIDELMKEWPVGPTTLGLEERKRHQRTTTLFKRGDFKSPGAPVTPGVPAVLHPMPAGEYPSRLTLARWLASVENPLTPRVIVNRIWQSYFGLGIVPTSEDFGTRAEPPSHPELLDWLATELPRQGWSLKAIHRLIVTSAAYRQSSRANLESLERDPYNRLLARGARLRLESEGVRDVVLEASGLLSRKIGGQSVYPPIPDGVLNLGYGAPMPWPTSTGEDRYRRGLYTFWKRTIPYPGLLIFDSPNADFSCVRRLRSNTPLQALTTLNDAAFHEAAQAMALRVWREGGAEDRSRAIHAFRLATGRVPKEAELAPLLDLVKGEESYFENRTAAAVKVASPDPASPPPDVNLHKVAAWTMVCRVILNLDETITKE